MGNRKDPLDTSCDDCRMDTMREYYMVHDSVWVGEAGLPHYYCILCVGCLERRIRRKLTPADFTDCLLNQLHCRFPKSERLLSRIEGGNTYARLGA